MKIRLLIIAGLVTISVIGIATAFYQQEQSIYENKITVAFFPNIGHIVPIVGYETGIFADGLGNKTLIQTRVFDSGPQVIESIFAGSIDIAYVGPGPAINGFLKTDHGIKILSGAASGGASFIVHPNSNITSIEDFSGKKIAAPQIGNTQDISLRSYLLENGLSPAEKGGSVVIFNIANPDIYTLFAKGDIDGAWVPEPWATIFVKELGGKRLFYEEDIWPNKQFASVLLIGRTDYVEKHPEIIQKWIESNDKTVKWINTNPNKSKLIFNEFMKKTLGKALPEDIVNESFSNLEITSDPIPDSIGIFTQRAESLGYLGRNGYDLQGIFYDNSTLEESK